MPFDGKMPERPIEPLEVLVAARHKLARGWCKGTYCVSKSVDEISTYCLVGAYRSAALDYNVGVLQTPARIASVDEIIEPVLVKELPFFWRLTRNSRHEKLVAFNDCRWRRKRAVVALYDRAIKRLQAR